MRFPPIDLRGSFPRKPRVPFPLPRLLTPFACVGLGVDGYLPRRRRGGRSLLVASPLQFRDAFAGREQSEGQDFGVLRGRAGLPATAPLEASSSTFIIYEDAAYRFCRRGEKMSPIGPLDRVLPNSRMPVRATCLAGHENLPYPRVCSIKRFNPSVCLVKRLSLEIYGNDVRPIRPDPSIGAERHGGTEPGFVFPEPFQFANEMLASQIASRRVERLEEHVGGTIGS